MKRRSRWCPACAPVALVVGSAPFFVVGPAAAVGVIGSWGYVEVDEVFSKPSPGGYS